MLSYRSPGRHDEAEERQLSLQEALATETASMADSYCSLCTTVQVVPHSGVLAFIRLRLAELRPLEREGFADRDMYAFCDFLLRDGAAAKATFEHPNPEPSPRTLSLSLSPSLSRILTCWMPTPRPNPPDAYPSPPPDYRAAPRPRRPAAFQRGATRATSSRDPASSPTSGTGPW